MTILKTRHSLAIVAALATPALADSTPSQDEMWKVIQTLQAENTRLKNESGPTIATISMAGGGAADDIKVSTGGFIRADVGLGDRYGDGHEEDYIGISKAALAVTSQYKNVQGVFVVGTEVTTLNNSDQDGNVDIKDAFIVINDFGAKGLTMSIGAQPLLFGLKPNGYPGDRSLSGSVEYGAGDTFASSNQAGPSLIGDWAFNNSFSLRLGIFDQSDYKDSGSIAVTAATDGSSLSDNYFIQFRITDLMGTGLYANAGTESRYVGGTVDSNESISTLGIGWKNSSFDISAEYVSLDEAFVSATDDENYLVVEATLSNMGPWTLYLDYSEADEQEITTFRLGAGYAYNKHTTFSIEYGDDEYDSSDNDVDSIDLRVTLSY